jgi:hypothetical protein
MCLRTTISKICFGLKKHFKDDRKDDGPCISMMETMRNEVMDIVDDASSGVTLEEAREIVVLFDAMRMRKSMIMSASKETLARTACWCCSSRTTGHGQVGVRGFRCQATTKRY